MFDFDPKQVVRDELKAASHAMRTHQGATTLYPLSQELSEHAQNIAQSINASQVSPVVLKGFFRISEWFLILITGITLFYLYLSSSVSFNGLYALLSVAISFLTLIIFQFTKLYKISIIRRLWMQLGRLFLAWSFVFLISLSFLFFLKISEEFSRLWLAAWFVCGFFVLLFYRLFLRYLVFKLARDGRLERRTVLVGGGKKAEELIKALEQSDYSDVKICGVFDDRSDERSPDSVSGYPKLGTIDNLVAFARAAHIDLILVTLPITAEMRLLEVLKKLWVLPVDIRLSAHSNKLRLRPRSYSYIGGVPFFALFDKPMADWDVIGKHLFDRVIGALILVLVSPVMLMVALAIKLDSKGPVFFKQKRHGFNNQLINVYKFRSMYTDQSDQSAAKLVTKDDPRVTRVGRFIRKTSLDELPQLFNVVFKNDLSLVGPRPHALSAKAAGGLYQDVVDGYFARHKVKPGITGWAQISGWRGETDTLEKIQKRVEHDLYYIENWSLALDLRILFMTPISLFAESENAY